MSDECRFLEAFEYAEIASNTFRTVYSSVHYKSIQALWSLLSISYAIHKAKPVPNQGPKPQSKELGSQNKDKDKLESNKETINMCNQLFYALNKRDYLKEK
jgi:hypothetical protein